MLAALSAGDRARVYKKGNWIRPSRGLPRLDHKGFKMPVDPVYVPIPPEARPLVARYSSSVVDPTEPEGVTPVAGPSIVRTGQAPGSGPHTFGTTFFLLVYLSASNFSLSPLGFGEIPHDGVGRTATTRSRGRARSQLKTARERRYREATPDHALRPLPKLISARDLVVLRKNIPVVRPFFPSRSALTNSLFFLEPSAWPQMSYLLYQRASLHLARLVGQVRGLCSQ